MNIIVDTCVWSLVLRRKVFDPDNPWASAFLAHLDRGDGLHLVGNILQELLDGVRSQTDFNRLVDILKPFPLIKLTRDTYILAAQLRNDCQKKGVHASPTDFLIAATGIEHGYPLLTSDKDFTRISKHSDLMICVP
ncbi:MAG: PIN domain-containing protein [Deltaproteobacteria bacterium]|nr:PIN domain-containing protein [Deltaproteobacteria bacterium]